MWVVNDKSLNWSGARVLIMAAVQQTKGRRGGLALIIIRDIEYTEINRTFIGDQGQNRETEHLNQEHLQEVTIFNSEDSFPDEYIDVEYFVELEVPVGRGSEGEM